MLTFLNQIDGEWTRTVNHWSGSAFFDTAMTIVSSSLLWLTIGVIAAAYFIVKRKATSLAIMISALIALALTDYVSFEFVKQFVKRERPCWELQGMRWVLNSCGGSYGFTSNHAANAAAFVTTLWLWRSTVERKILCVATLSALMVGFSRVYLGVHYIGDVLGGFVLGFIIAIILNKTPLAVFSRRAADLICKRTNS